MDANEAAWLRKLGAENMLSQEELVGLTGLQITFEKDLPPRIDTRSKVGAHYVRHCLKEINGKWEETN